MVDRAKRESGADDCTCTVTGPDYDDTTTDPACPYHGEHGSMVARLRPTIELDLHGVPKAIGPHGQPTDLGKCDCGCWDYQQLLAERDRLRGQLLRYESMGAVRAVAQPLHDALTALWEPIENLRGYHVNEQTAFLAHVDSILNRIRGALHDDHA